MGLWGREVARGTKGGAMKARSESDAKLAQVGGAALMGRSAAAGQAAPGHADKQAGKQADKRQAD